MAPVERNVI